MQGQPPPTNPLHAAARETMAVARETKSPLLERVAVIGMIASALTTMGLAIMQGYHMLRRDEERREKDRVRDRRSDPSSPPPDRPGHGGAATAGMYPDRDGDEARRWTRREEHAEAAARGRQR